jgi:hypothetical protein
MDMIRIPLQYAKHYCFLGPLSPFEIAFLYVGSPRKPEYWEKIADRVTVVEEVGDWMVAHSACTALGMNDTDEICFTFEDPTLAMLFKLTWL